jgi:acyl-CoA thioesterase FadM
MFDACTAAMFERAGLQQAELTETYGIVGWPVVEVSVALHVPSTVGDDVDIETQIHEWGTSSFKVHHRLLKRETLAIESHQTPVWIEHPAGTAGALRSKPIPPEIARFA